MQWHYHITTNTYSNNFGNTNNGLELVYDKNELWFYMFCFQNLTIWMPQCHTLTSPHNFSICLSNVDGALCIPIFKAEAAPNEIIFVIDWVNCSFYTFLENYILSELLLSWLILPWRWQPNGALVSNSFICTFSTHCRVVHGLQAKYLPIDDAA